MCSADWPVCRIADWQSAAQQLPTCATRLMESLAHHKERPTDLGNTPSHWRLQAALTRTCRLWPLSPVWELYPFLGLIRFGAFSPTFSAFGGRSAWGRAVCGRAFSLFRSGLGFGAGPRGIDVARWPRRSPRSSLLDSGAGASAGGGNGVLLSTRTLSVAVTSWCSRNSTSWSPKARIGCSTWIFRLSSEMSN